MVGLLENIQNKMTLDFKQAGDVIYLIGESRDDINSSEYIHKIWGVEFSPVPYFNLEEEFYLQQTVSNLINKKMIRSAHDISEGGLFVTLAESGFNRNLGFSIMQQKRTIRKDAWWFGEAQSRVVVSVEKDEVDNLEKLLENIPFEKLGVVTTGRVDIENEDWGDISFWREKYDTAIEIYFKNYLPE
jgi:phosphoribosylformylglycinamidine synthase